jgi:hypothetical protein
MMMDLLCGKKNMPDPATARWLLPSRRSIDVRRQVAVTALSLSFLMGSGAPALVRADDFETPTVAQASTLMPAAFLSGPNFKVQPAVRAIGFFNEWIVDSDFGSFNVTGDAALKKLVPEIYAIADLDKISRGEAFVKAVGSAAKSPFQLGYSLITSPVSTVSSIPSGIGRLFENVGESVGASKGPTEDSSLEQALVVSSWKRDYAAQAGVDVYSSNEVLQKQLNRIGWAAAIGGLSVSAATMSVSGPATVVLGNMRLAKSITDVLKAEPPARLRIINRDKLKAMGIPDQLTERFLENTVYTPRGQTILVASLDALGTGIKGRDAFLTSALQAQDETEATFYMNTAQAMEGYVRSVSSLTEIFPFGRLVMATTQKGRVFSPAPVDRVFWTAKTRQFCLNISNAATKAGYGGKVDVWLTGTASPRTQQEMTKLGLNLTQNVATKLGISY